AHTNDVDSDGDVDVLTTTCIQNRISWFENDGSQAFTEHVIGTNFFRPHMVRTADFDNDNDIDVLAAAINSNEIAWWENIGGTPIQWTKHMLSSSFNGATGIHAVDMDVDGDIDVLGAAQFGNAISWWESDVVGIEEGGNVAIHKGCSSSTIIRGQLTLPHGQQCCVYDIMGKKVTPLNLKPGIYFVKTENSLYKIVKVQ
ncbi:MAG: VCBS repeat-containing protein, partial [Gammaproteobacteria bacterium]|nr:VCBS repeat-containing protein [Gammaproteobacteria bacterium]